MAFCTNCGKQLPEGARFCAVCGSLATQETTTNPEGRKAFYDGEIHKCPNCGEVLKAFETICPSCKFELRGAKGSNTIKDFQDKLERATSEKQKIIIIKSFPVPNTKEDIFEFMILASSNFDVSYYVEHLNEDDISDAWLAKIEQCYQKAKLSFRETTDFIEIEAIYQKIKNECAEKKTQIKNDIKKAKLDRERTSDAEKFKKGKFKIVLIVFAILSALFSAVSFPDNILSGIIAIIMSALFITSFLIGINVIKAKFKNMHLLFAILAFVLIIPYFSFFDTNSNTTNENSSLVWENIVLCDELPTPKATHGRVLSNSEHHLSVYISNITESDYTAYIASCKNYGYSIDAETSTSSYDAYNEKGYKLRIWYSEYSKEFNISLDEPIKQNTIVWDSIQIMSQLPTLPSSTGEISSESGTSFAVYVLNIDKNQYNAYVNSCIEKGFDIDYKKYENSFYGSNENGYKLSLEYKGFDTLYLYIRAD